MGDYEEREGAFIHHTANIVGEVRIGKGSRIDAFVTITGPTIIGRHVHIGGLVCLLGGSGLEIGDYVGISPGTKVFTATEDPSGEWITNPTVPIEMRNPKSARVLIEDHSLIGANSVLLPGAYFPEGACCGALSLVKHSLTPWSIWAGVPARKIKERSKGVLNLVNNAPAIREKVVCKT